MRMQIHTPTRRTVDPLSQQIWWAKFMVGVNVAAAVLCVTMVSVRAYRATIYEPLSYEWAALVSAVFLSVYFVGRTALSIKRVEAIRAERAADTLRGWDG